MENREYLSISDINRIIKFTIDSNEILRSVYIKGEVSNLKYHGRGHLYFSLKDESSKINAVMFNYQTSGLTFEPKDGDAVLVHGKISVYEATGSYQIYVDSMEQDGIGNLYQLFEELKKKLSKEGLFDEKYKQKINRLPERIGVITASTGAAIRDVISTINKRYPLVEIYVFPTLVQGSDAAPNIVKMIELANSFPLDTIILGRGGGSIEDLWAFNEEIVARAIFNSKIPIISGVGHEIDFTISDFVADLRAPTPTGAAIMATRDKEEIISYLESCKSRINNALDNKLQNAYEILKKFKSNYILNNPTRLYDIQEQKLDILYDKLNNAINLKLDNLKKKTETYKIKLDLLNPVSIIDKGYSIVYKDNKIIKDISLLSPNDDINIIVKNGKINADVKGVEKNGREDI